LDLAAFFIAFILLPAARGEVIRVVAEICVDGNRMGIDRTAGVIESERLV
jgi:hypothetical protein